MPGERSGEGKGNGCHRACARAPSQSAVLILAGLWEGGRTGTEEEWSRQRMASGRRRADAAAVFKGLRGRWDHRASSVY